MSIYIPFRSPVRRIPIAFYFTLSLLCLGAQASAQKTSLSDMPGAIDGAKNPELIPDQVAYRLFFLAIAEPSSPTPQQQRRQRAKLQAVHLNEVELQIVAATVARFHDDLNQFNTEFNAASKLSLASGQALDVEQWVARRDSITDSAQIAIRQQLTPSGLRRLEENIQSRKPKMVMFPPPVMNHSR